MEVHTGKRHNLLQYGHLTRVKYDCFETAKIDLRTWFRTRCTGDVFIAAAYIYFENDQDATIFKLGLR